MPPSVEWVIAVMIVTHVRNAWLGDYGWLFLSAIIFDGVFIVLNNIKVIKRIFRIRSASESN